jgi:hypothetical protein
MQCISQEYAKAHVALVDSTGASIVSQRDLS